MGSPHRSYSYGYKLIYMKSSHLPLVFIPVGIMHFVKPEEFDKIIPNFIPGSKRFWTYASGVAELVCAAGLLNAKTSKAADLASAGLLAGVWPANFQMAWDWRHEPWQKQLITIGRLPLQIPMIKAALEAYRGD